MQCSTVKCIIVQCRALQCRAVQCSVVQCSVECSTVHITIHSTVLQCPDFTWKWDLCLRPPRSQLFSAFRPNSVEHNSAKLETVNCVQAILHNWSMYFCLLTNQYKHFQVRQNYCNLVIFQLYFIILKSVNPYYKLNRVAIMVSNHPRASFTPLQ